MANNKDNKKRNWLTRLKYLKIRKRPMLSSEEANGEGNILRPEEASQLPNSSSVRSHNSLQRSIMKMHSRVKRAFRKSSNINREISVSSNTVTNATMTNLPVLQNRVTLHSPTQHIENTYSIEPGRYTCDNSANSDSSFIRLSSQTSQDLIEPSAPEVPPRRNCPEILVQVLKNEIANMWNYYWYWGPISGGQAEARLKDAADGSFLVRDSTSDRYVFTMSFRNVGKILHTRIDFSKTGYSLFDQIEYSSIAELVEDAMAKSKLGVYCYTKAAKDDIQPNFPVRLLLPISRYDKVPSLKYLSRFVIRQFLNVNDIRMLPLPKSLLEYLQDDERQF